MLAVVRKTVIQGIKIEHLSIALAILLLLFALPALFDPKRFREAAKDFFASSPLVRLAGFLFLIVAFLILNTHRGINLNSARSIMAALGYLIAIKGVVWLWFPGFARKFAMKKFENDARVYIFAFVCILAAVGLGYLGIWVY